MSESSCVEVRPACWRVDVVILRVRDLPTAEGRLAAAAAVRSSDPQTRRVCAEALVPGAVAPELEREHKKLVALQRYPRARGLRRAFALEGVVACGLLRARRP